MYARAMTLSKEKEQQFRASVGRGTRAVVGDAPAPEERMPPVTALPPLTLPRAQAASCHTPQRPAAAAAAAAANTPDAATTVAPPSDETSAVDLVNTVLLAALPMVKVGSGRLIAKLNELGGLPMAGKVSSK